jgi:hypothetical protein
LASRALIAIPLLAASLASAECLPERVGKRDPLELIEGAVRVLRSCGYDPERYRVQLTLEHPFTVADPDLTRETRVLFEPLEPERLHAVSVSAEDPCMLRWVWRPERFTPWQRRMLARFEQPVTEARASENANGAFELSILESVDHLAARWRFGPASEGRGAVVLPKEEAVAE